MTLQERIGPGYKQTEVGVIPEDWDIEPLGRLFEIQLGKMLDEEKNFGIPKPYVGNRAVQWGRIDATELPRMKMSPRDLARFQLKNGDILVCEGGEIGRSAIWRSEVEECYYQKALHRLRPTANFDRRLILAIFQSYAERGLFANYVTQTSIAHLPKEKLVGLPIPVPPPDEQRAIADALGDADAWIAGLEAVIAKKRNLKQAAMQQLLTGKTRLPGFGPRVTKYKQSGVGVIPEDWHVSRLGEVCSFENGDRGANYPSGNDFVTIGCPFVNAGHLGDGNIKADQLDYITREKFERLGNGKFRPDDVLFCLRGSLGKFAVVDEDLPEGAIASSLIIIRPLKAWLTVTYFVSYLRSRICSSMIDLWAGGAAQPNLGGRELARFLIPLPPDITEQSAIAEVLADMDADLAALEAEAAKARAIKQGMMQTLLTGQVRLV